MERYGYGLICPGGLTKAQFVESMNRHGITADHRFLDVETRVQTKHEQFDALLSCLRSGDEVWLNNLACLAATIPETLSAIAQLEKKAVSICLADFPDTAAGGLYNVLLYWYNTEKTLRRRRQEQGFTDAMARDGRRGRKPIPKPRNYNRCMDEVFAGRISNAEAITLLDIGRTTYFAWLKEERRKRGLLKEGPAKEKK